MAYYLIDYENVHVAGLNGLSSLTENDKVVIFYSDSSDSLTFGLHRRIMTAVCEVSYQKVETGTKNALDFQLSSYLGYIISENKENTENKFFIITKDNGFNILSEYWKKHKISVEIADNLTGTRAVTVVPKVVVKSETKAENPTEIEKTIEKILTNKSEIDFVLSTVRKGKTKSDINNEINRHFKESKKVHNILTAIKPFIKNMKGS